MREADYYELPGWPPAVPLPPPAVPALRAITPAGECVAAQRERRLLGVRDGRVEHQLRNAPLPSSRGVEGVIREPPRFQRLAGDPQVSAAAFMSRLAPLLRSSRVRNNRGLGHTQGSRWAFNRYFGEAWGAHSDGVWAVPCDSVWFAEFRNRAGDLVGDLQLRVISPVATAARSPSYSFSCPDVSCADCTHAS